MSQINPFNSLPASLVLTCLLGAAVFINRATLSDDPWILIILGSLVINTGLLIHSRVRGERP